MLLHVHNDATDALKLCTVANDFVFAKELRVSIYGQFWMVEVDDEICVVDL